MHFGDLDIEIGLPSVEWPFGVHLWPIFDWAYTQVVGKPAESFHFEQGVQYFSDLYPTLAAISTYYLIVFGGREILKPFPAHKLNGLFQIHNFVLTSVSLILLLLFAEQLIPMIYHHGLFYAICSWNAWTQKLELLYYLNYLVKFVELLDTVFLVIKKKQLTFLHTYHHGATALLCYTQMIGTTSVSWVPITLNLAVHVVMYFYYFLSARGIRVWWKEWVTRFQIIQFVIDLVFVYFSSYIYFTSTYFPNMPNSFGSCSGEEFAAISGMAILSSYLVLFIAFYISTYATKRTRSQSTAAIAAHKLAAAEPIINSKSSKSRKA